MNAEQAQGFAVGEKVKDKRTGKRGQVLRLDKGTVYLVWFAFGDTAQRTASELEAVTA